MSTLRWVNPATSNRFGNKHMLVISDASSLKDLESAGYEVFNKRIQAYRLNKSRNPNVRQSDNARQLKAQFGVGKKLVTDNTLIVMHQSSLQSLEMQIAQKRYKSQEYQLANGIVFQMSNAGYDVGLVASIHLSIRPCIGGHEVYHLEGTQVTAMRSMSEAAKNQTKVIDNGLGSLGLRYTPTINELNTMKGKLRSPSSFSSSAGKPPIWALSEIAGVDLSFLDD
ncbi:MAG: hypothetical protein R3240_04755 [Gammaproteobacteria bacterium]|nr:hypothetical protein [Gammaproteobacteria bacterium]